MPTPIAANYLNELAEAGISPANVMEELLWLQWNGIDMTRHEARHTYLRMTRAGRNFALNRRQRNMICDYALRVAEVIVTNVEVFNAVNLEESVG